MRYKEFKNAVGDWGRKYDYKPIIKINGYSVLLKMTINGKYKPMVRISNIDSYALDTNYLYFNYLANDAKQDLYKIVTEFATTPIEDREDKEREDNKTFDSIIHRLEVIQTDMENVMNKVEEIQEGNRNLRNALEDIIIDLEEYKEKQELPYEITDMQGMFAINNTDIPF